MNKPQTALECAREIINALNQLRHVVIPQGENEAAAIIEAHAQQRCADLVERLQAIIDWADLALANPQITDSFGAKNLDGPVFDEARTALAQFKGENVDGKQ